jgi:hypothetical protein
MEAPAPLVLRHRQSGSLIDETGWAMSGVEWLRAMMEHGVPERPWERPVYVVDELPPWAGFEGA